MRTEGTGTSLSDKISHRAIAANFNQHRANSNHESPLTRLFAILQRVIHYARHGTADKSINASVRIARCLQRSVSFWKSRCYLLIESRKVRRRNKRVFPANNGDDCSSAEHYYASRRVQVYFKLWRRAFEKRTINVYSNALLSCINHTRETSIDIPTKDRRFANETLPGFCQGARNDTKKGLQAAAAMFTRLLSAAIWETNLPTADS